MTLSPEGAAAGDDEGDGEGEGEGVAAGGTTGVAASNGGGTGDGEGEGEGNEIVTFFVIVTSAPLSYDALRKIVYVPGGTFSSLMNNDPGGILVLSDTSSLVRVSFSDFAFVPPSQITVKDEPLNAVCIILVILRFLIISRESNVVP